MLRVGIIGWSENTERLISAFHFGNKNTELLAFSSNNEAARRYVMDKYGLKHVFQYPERLLEFHQLDIVCITSEGEKHLDQVKSAMSNGFNVLLDYPMASNVEDCQNIQSIIENHPSLKAMIAFPRRFNSELEQIKKFIDSKELGDLIQIRISNFKSKENVVAPLKSHFKGPASDLGIEDIDLIHWLTESVCKNVVSLDSTLKFSNNRDHHETVNCIGHLENGTMFNIMNSRSSFRGEGFEMDVLGSKASLKYNDITERISIHPKNDSVRFYKIDTKESEYQLLANYFVDCVKYGNRLNQNLEDPINATKTVVAISKSQVLGQWIEV